MSFSIRKPGWSLAIVVLLILLPGQSQADVVDFKRDIAPILEERCWACHGEEEQESELRLDRRVNMLRGGNSGLSAVVPGKPEKSYLIDVIKHLDPDVKMPPDEEKIPANEIELLSRWIKEGAVWPGQMDAVVEEKSDHWSFQRVRRPEVPGTVSGSNNPVDAFLRQSLAKHQLSFSPVADSRSLIRRASIVLTGIAPTPEETSEFINDSTKDSEKGYSALIDRLLASPHFGERWAQHWLDVIRWAETNGSEANLYRKNAWIYRDYVVRAFNEDKPYDQFVREQIAGDSLGAGEATGFLVAGPHVPAATVGREPTAIRQARADRMDEIIQTVGASVMGVTIGCARCHNHKFDPITITDYYSMTGVFQDIEFGGRFPEFSLEHPKIAGPAGATSSRGFSGLPRCSTRVTSGRTSRPTKLGRGPSSASVSMSFWISSRAAFRSGCCSLSFLLTNHVPTHGCHVPSLLSTSRSYSYFGRYGSLSR